MGRISVSAESGRNSLLQNEFSVKQPSVLGKNYGYLNLGERGGVSGVRPSFGKGFKCIKRSSRLAGLILSGREEVEPGIWPPGHVTTSRAQRWGS